MTPDTLTAAQWKRIVQPESEHYQARLDAPVAEHLGWTPVTSERAESTTRRAWVVGGYRYNNLKAVRALYRMGVQV